MLRIPLPALFLSTCHIICHNWGFRLPLISSIYHFGCPSCRWCRRDISPEIENLYIIKIVLQPIIENAAIHGIYEREDGTGTITVHGYRKGEDVYIEVADDGIGMPQEKADAVFSSPPGEIAREPGGYGVKNISDRLKIAYGYEYGLSCKSVPGAGTVVTIHIPAVIEISNE